MLFSNRISTVDRYLLQTYGHTDIQRLKKKTLIFSTFFGDLLRTYRHTNIQQLKKQTWTFINISRFFGDLLRIYGQTDIQQLKKQTRPPLTFQDFHIFRFGDLIYFLRTLMLILENNMLFIQRNIFPWFL